MADNDQMFAEFNALSTGGATQVATAMKDCMGWDNGQVLKHLEGLGLPASVIGKFKDLEVTGEDLITLTENELKVDLDITRLQAKKIKRSIGGNLAHQEAADAAEEKAAVDNSKTGVLAPPADISTAEEPTTKHALQAQSSVKRNRSQAAPSQDIVVDAALVETWAAKTALIAMLEKAEVASSLPVAQQRLQYYREAFNSERKKLEELMEENEKLMKKHAKLDDGGWYIGKNLIGQKKRDQKVEEAERKADDASRKMEAARKVVEDLAQKVKIQEGEVSKLGNQVQALLDAKRWEEKALFSAFGGSAGDDRENQLEVELAHIVPQVEQARKFKVSYAQAYELIRAARKQLDGANQAFHAANGMARLDVMQDVFSPAPFQNSGMGLVADMAKRAQNRQGVALCEQAAGNIIRAAQIIPDMPRIDLQHVKGLKDMGIMDVVFDNVISDMRAMQQIQNAMHLVETMLRDIQYVERWLQGWLEGKIVQDLRALESAYARKKEELDHCRRDLLQALVAKNNNKD